MKVNFSEVAPIQEIFENFLVNGNGDMTAGYGVLFPEVFTQSHKEYLSIHTNFIKTIKRLPVNSIFHYQGYFYTNEFNAAPQKATDLLQQENFKYYDKREVLRNHNYFWLTVNNKSLGKITAINNSLLRMANYVFNKPFKDVKKTFDAYQSTVESFESTMNAMKGLQIKKLNGEQLKNAIYDYFSLMYANKREKAKGKVNPPIQIEDGFMKVGDQYVAIVSLIGEGDFLNACQNNKGIPSAMTKVKVPNDVGLPTSMTFPLGLGLPFNHILNVSIEILENEEILNSLKQQKTGLFLLKAFSNSEAKAKIKEIGDNNDGVPGFIDAVAEQGYQICKTRVNVIINDNNLKRLQEKVSIASNAYAQMNDSLVQVENSEVGNIFFTSAPGNIRHNYKSFVQAVDQAVTYLPKETQYLSDSNGIVFVDRFGKPTVLNMWDNPYIMNKNKVVFGPTGSGKSVFVNNLISQSFAIGNIVICIDIGGSYKKNCEINRGHYFDASNSKNMSFNIFLCDQDTSGNYLYKQEDLDGEGADDTINFIYSILIRIWKGQNTSRIKNEEKTVLKKIIAAFYDHVNSNAIFPDMKEFQKYLKIYQEDMSEIEKKYIDLYGLGLVLEPYVTGQYKYLLNSKSTLRIRENRYTVFDLEAIKDNEDIRTIVIAIILNDVTYIIDRIKGKRKSLIIDEAIDFLTGDMGEFIASQYRKIRKRNGEVYLATQGIGYLDVLDKLTRKSIFGNSNTKILLSHKADRDSYPLLRKYLSLTDFDIELLDSLDEGNHEFFIKMGQYSRVFRGDYSPFALGVYTTNSDEVEEIDELLKTSGSLKTAIYDFLDNKRRRAKEETERQYAKASDYD